MDENQEDEVQNVKDLTIACQKEDIKTIKTLLKDFKVPVDRDDSTGKKPLHHCANNRETQAAELIFAADGSCLNSKDENGFTAFLLAVVSGNKKMVKYLISKGTNVRAQDNEGHTAVHWSAVCGHPEILETVHLAGADLSMLDHNGASALHYASHGGENSSSEQNMKVVKMLLVKKVKIDVVDEDQRTPLLWAASSGRDKICEILLDADANIEAADLDGLTSLHSAAAKGFSKCVEILLRRKAKIDSVDKNMCTPLFYAVHQNHLDCVRMLLKNKANPNYRDIKGRSVAHCGAAIDNLPALKLLKEYKGDLWMTSQAGDLPIHEAAIAGNTDVVVYLFEQRKKYNNDLKDMINKSNSNGRTCLHMAALASSLPLSKYLVENGADVNAIMKHDHGQLKPYDCARIKHSQPCADYLKQQGGRSIIEPEEYSPVLPSSSDNSNEKKEEEIKNSISYRNNVNQNPAVKEEIPIVLMPKKPIMNEIAVQTIEQPMTLKATKSNQTDQVKTEVKTKKQEENSSKKASPPKTLINTESQTSQSNIEEPNQINIADNITNAHGEENKFIEKPKLVEMECQTEETRILCSDNNEDEDIKDIDSSTQESNNRQKKSSKKELSRENKKKKASPQKNQSPIKKGVIKTNAFKAPNTDINKSPQKTALTDDVADECDKESENNDSYSTDSDHIKNGDAESDASNDDKLDDQNNDSDFSDKSECENTKPTSIKNQGKNKNRANDKQSKGKPNDTNKPKKSNKTGVKANPPIESRRLLNLNLHQKIIREQVRAYETKRLAAMKMNNSIRASQMNGKYSSEERLVRKLAKDYNEDARADDRIPSGHFKTIRDFHQFLKGEINIADNDEKRLRKLEKVKPIYYVTF